MAFETVKEFPLANIVRVEIETEEQTPKQYRLTDVYSEAEVTAVISEGEEQELRVKNVIKAQNMREDIVKGYDIRLVAVTMVPEVLALIDGGTLTYDSMDPNKVVKYDAPPVGSPVQRKKFTLHIYTEEKDVNGDVVSYVKFTYLHCTGRPVNYTLQDNAFFVPEFTIRSRPKSGEKPVTIEFLDQLPA